MTPAEITALVEAVIIGLRPPDPPAPDPVLPSGINSAEEFFDRHLSQIFARDLDRGDNSWCGHWREHREARMVIQALWDSWEHFRMDQAMGMAVWLTSYAYPLMGRLFDPQGTFCACNEKSHDPHGVVALPSLLAVQAG